MSYDEVVDMFIMCKDINEAKKLSIKYPKFVRWFSKEIKKELRIN